MLYISYIGGIYNINVIYIIVVRYAKKELNRKCRNFENKC